MPKQITPSREARHRVVRNVRPSGPTPPGRLVITTETDRVDVWRGYKGPSSERDFPYALPARSWSPIEGRRRPARKRSAAAGSVAAAQVDGRAYTVDQVWSGQRFLFKVDNLPVQDTKTTFNVFTTHLGRKVAGVDHWTEIGIIRAAQDTRYRLFTYDPHQNPQYRFFGETYPGEVFEFVIRLNENDPGPYRYETFCSGVRVRKGELPRLDCQVDVSHESFSDTGAYNTGDYMIAVEGWVNYPPNKALWFSSGLDIVAYTGDSSVKKVRLKQPIALKFESYS